MNKAMEADNEILRHILSKGADWEYLNPEGEWSKAPKKASAKDYAVIYELRVMRKEKKARLKKSYFVEAGEWRLPEPPPGRTWRWPYHWNKDRLPAGWRPLLDGEQQQPEDWESPDLGDRARRGGYHAALDGPDLMWTPVRTQRPIPQ